MSQPALKPEFRTFGGPAGQLEVVGIKTSVLRDAFHFLLIRPWWVTITAVGLVFGAVNTVFALGYWWLGGIANAQPDSFRDAFFFSVQTLGTIGYGYMYPQSLAANLLVALESLAGVMVLALSTGIAYAKFARSDARILFTRGSAVCLVDGEPHLMFRVANQRGHLVTSARLTVSVVREHVTAEGMRIYRMLDLALVRDQHPAFTRSWTVLHRIDPQSPLHGCTPESLVAEDMELVVSLEGMDVTSSQLVTAQHSYLAREIVWGVRLADIWADLPAGRARLDFRRFHDTVPTAPTPEFPYSGGKRVGI